jgi:hypothetical protein
MFTIKQAEAIVGGLSKTSKMPTDSISLPASLCKTGSKLRQVPGSVCSKCYACKGAYSWGNVQAALETRYKALEHPQWVDAMVSLLESKKRIKDSGLFRWHDSGDIQSVEHLANIVRVVKRTPNVKHWIPTKEKALIREYTRKHGAFPDNMIVRLSGAMIDGPIPRDAEHTSTVTTDPAKATCRAFENDGQCGTCRQCWDSNVRNVVYLSH